MKPLDRAALLGALTSLQRKAFTDPMLPGALTIQELTARQRQTANEAALAAGGDLTPDNALYRACVVQMGVVDAKSGAPLLEAGDVEALTNGREQAVNRLASAILELSGALPGDLKSGDPAADEGQPDAGAGA